MGFNTQNQRSVTLTRAANQAFTAATPAAMTWDTSVSNPNGLWNSAANQSRITIDKPGLYLVLANPISATNGTTGSNAIVRKNGATTLLTNTAPVLSTAAFGLPLVGACLLAIGDYLEVVINSGASVNWTGYITVALIHPQQDWSADTEAV